MPPIETPPTAAAETPSASPPTETPPTAAKPADGPITRKPVEIWAAEKGTPAWKVKAAATLHRWFLGPSYDPVILDEAEYDKAIEAAATVGCH